jgi:hypothetical protein|tara:strand:- start:1227 stop:1343 length:117 start_codon:yes stop_codon:yes gene_type:complete
MALKLEKTELIREHAKRTISLFSAIALAALDDAMAKPF